MSRILPTACVAASVLAAAAVAETPRFTHVTEGTPLDLSLAPEEGRDTQAVQHFLATGVNLYNENPAFLPAAEEIYLGMCSGCHGHHAEGKIGPGLNDTYWSYPSNRRDVGLFNTIFGGARGQMGPMYGALTLDEMLLSMAWVRHLYTGEARTAVWLTPEQRERFTPYPFTQDDGS